MLTKTAKNVLPLVTCLFLVHHFANADQNIPTPILSANVSNVVAGNAFKLSCEMPSSFAIGDSELHVWFGYIFQRPFETPRDGYLLSYTVQEKKIGSNQPRERVAVPYIADQYTPYIASVVPVNTTNATSNIFDIIITTRASRGYHAQFFCYALYAGHSSANSKHVHVNVTDPFAAPTLANSVSQVRVNESFTLTCLLPSGFKPANQQYEVAFFNNRDGLMASYEVDASGKVFLSSKVSQYNLSSVLPGSRAAFPNFDLQVVETYYRELSYWCQLRTLNSTTLKPIFTADSTKWKSVGPYVDFSSTTNGTAGNNLKLQGMCSLSAEDSLRGHEFQILFYSDLGDYNVSNNLLGYYSARPFRATTFVAESLVHWTSIESHAFDWLRFGIAAQLEAGLKPNNNKWWCALNYTEPVTKSARLIKSNVKSLL